MHELEGAGAGYLVGHVAGHDGYPVVAEYYPAVDEMAREVLVLVGLEEREFRDCALLQEPGRRDEDYVVARRAVFWGGRSNIVS